MDAKAQPGMAVAFTTGSQKAVSQVRDDKFQISVVEVVAIITDAKIV